MSFDVTWELIVFQSFKLTLNSVLQYYPNYVAEQKRFWIWEKEKDPIYAEEVKAVLECWRVGQWGWRGRVFAVRAIREMWGG